MAFFKDATATTSNKAIARLHKIIWTLIFGGLLTLVLGLSTRRMDDTCGWSMVVVGLLLAGAGVVLIYVRSKMKTEA